MSFTPPAELDEVMRRTKARRQFRLRGLLLFTLSLSFVFGAAAYFASGPPDVSGFENLTGDRARDWLGSSWPVGIDPSGVTAVSHRGYGERDGFSNWYRITLSPGAAMVWTDHVHTARERDSQQGLGRGYEGLEGVRRTIAGPPPLHEQTGDTPTWWAPPAIQFRATEAMLWYDGSGSGIGQATYSAFDESSGVLWIYDYSSQHDWLWSRGSPPNGDVFFVKAN